MGAESRPGEPGLRPLESASARDGATRIEFRSHDQDETREYLRRHHGNHTRVVRGKGSFLYTINAVGAGGVIVGRTERWLHQTLRAAVPHPTLFLSLNPGETISYGRKAIDLQPDRAVFSAAGHEYTRVGYASEHLVVRVESDLLEREIAARVRRRSSRWLPPSAPIPMTATRRAQLFDFESQMNAAAGAAGSWGQYGNLEALEAAIAGWMAELVLETAGVRSTSELGMARLVRLQRWIDAHIEQDITLDRLCSVAGVGPRSLQKALLAARGQTPHEFLTARRLSAARARLESAALPLRVSAIALDCGFRHFGRFSASYRMAFGESPVETARRAAGFSRKERDSNGA